MSVDLLLQLNPSAGLTLATGPEWGYRSKLEMALAWDQMTSGLWRKWDAGPARDLYVSTWTYRGITVAIDSFIRQFTADQGRFRYICAEEGFHPFGPLIDCTIGHEKLVRVGPPVAGPQTIGSDLWTISLDIYLQEVPGAAANLGSFTAFLERASFSPSLNAGWSIAARESGFASAVSQEASYQTVASAILSFANAQATLQRLMYLRGEPFTIAGSMLPFGPGVPYSSGYGSAYGCRAKAFSWQHLAPDTWEISMTLVRDP